MAATVAVALYLFVVATVAFVVVAVIVVVAVVPLACCSTLKCEKCVHYLPHNFPPLPTTPLPTTTNTFSESWRNENYFHFALVRSLAQKLNTTTNSYKHNSLDSVLLLAHLLVSI